MMTSWKLRAGAQRLFVASTATLLAIWMPAWEWTAAKEYQQSPSKRSKPASLTHRKDFSDWSALISGTRTWIIPSEINVYLHRSMYQMAFSKQHSTPVFRLKTWERRTMTQQNGNVSDENPLAVSPTLTSMARWGMHCIRQNHNLQHC